MKLAMSKALYAANVVASTRSSSQVTIAQATVASQTISFGDALRVTYVFKKKVVTGGVCFRNAMSASLVVLGERL